jgi:hypothetical protein
MQAFLLPLSGPRLGAGCADEQRQQIRGRARLRSEDVPDRIDVSAVQIEKAGDVVKMITPTLAISP